MCIDTAYGIHDLGETNLKHHDLERSPGWFSEASLYQLVFTGLSGLRARGPLILYQLRYWCS
jgi:hypothetical protein